MFALIVEFSFTLKIMNELKINSPININTKRLKKDQNLLQNKMISYFERTIKI